MSEIGDNRTYFARKMLSDRAWEIFRHYMRLEAYRLGKSGLDVPDLIDHCTEYAFREMGLDLSLGEKVVIGSMCDNTEYEEVMAAQRLMVEE